MSSSLILPIVFCILSIFSVGLVMVTHNIEKTTKTYFSLSIMTLVLWVLSVHFSNTSSSYALLINRLAFFFPLLSLSFFSLFIGTAYGKDLEPAKEKTYDYLAIIFATFGSVISLSGLGVVKVNEKLGSTGLFQGYSIVPGSLYYLLLAIFISSAICLGIRIVSTYRVAGGKRRDSLRTVITGLAVAVPLSIVTNLIGPLVFSDSLVASTLSNLAIIFFTRTYYW